MGRDLTQIERDVLEAMIDGAGLVAVLHGLSEICDAKADHIESSYSLSSTPDPLARHWFTAGGAIGVLSSHGSIMAIGEP